MRSGVRQTSSASRGVEHRRLPGARRDSTAELRLSVIRPSGDSTPSDLEVQMKLAHITKRKRRKIIGISLYHGIARKPFSQKGFLRSTPCDCHRASHDWVPDRRSSRDRSSPSEKIWKLSKLGFHSQHLWKVLFRCYAEVKENPLQTSRIRWSIATGAQPYVLRRADIG